MGLSHKAQAEEKAGRWQESSIARAPFGVLSGRLLDLLDASWVVRVRVGGQEARTQVGLLRCIFGNPFRPVAVDPAWRTTTVVQLAQGVYNDRAFDWLAILADALEEAGCTNADILGHLRGPGPHVRGCWVVDLVLGKE